MSRAGQPIAAAYEQTNARAVACPTCSAAAGEFCGDHHGRLHRVPHVHRIAAARPQAQDRRSATNGSDVVERPEVTSTVTATYRDPSEPRYEREVR